MAKHNTLESLFSDISNSIKAKTDGTADIVADDFPEAITNIANPVLVSLRIAPTEANQDLKCTDADGWNNVVVEGIQTETKTVTENGTYTPTSGKYYRSVTVNVQPSETKNIQAYHGMVKKKTSSLSSTGVKIVCNKTGIYKISWFGARSSTSGTNQSQLYIDGKAYGSAQGSFDSNISSLQCVTLTGVSLTKGQTVEVYARARSTSYYMAVGNLIVEEQ